MNRNHSQTQVQKQSPSSRPRTPTPTTTTTLTPETEPSAAANQAKQFLSPDAPQILTLQRTMGNKAIQRLIAQRQNKAQRHWMPGEPEEVQAMPAIQRHWMPGEPEEVQTKRVQREAEDDELQETPALQRVALNRGFGVPGYVQRRAMLRETINHRLWGNAAATHTVQTEKKEGDGSGTQTPAVFTGPITFNQTELPADGKATSQGTAKWTPPDRSVKWSIVGTDYGSTVTDTGQVKVGDNTQNNESVKLQVKVEDSADGSAFSTGFITLYDAKFFQAKLDFPKFVAGTYSFPNFTIGLNGKFDMDYQPASNRADATIKVKFAFPDEDLSKMGLGQMVSTIISQIERQQKFISQIAAQWSGRYQFKNVREPQSIWGKLNPVDVKVNVTPVTSGQHFTVNLYSKTKGRANVGGGQVHMFAGSDVPKPAFNPGTAQGELTRVRRNTPTPVLFANNSADVPGDAAAKLQFLGTYLSRIHNPKFEITIVGHASATGQKPKTRNSQKREPKTLPPSSPGPEPPITKSSPVG